MEKKQTITSTADFSKTVLSAKTPEVDAITFTEADFFGALKKVSRKQEPPPDAPPSDDKPKE